MSTENFSPIGPAVWPAISSIYIYIYINDLFSYIEEKANGFTFIILEFLLFQYFGNHSMTDLVYPCWNSFTKLAIMEKSSVSFLIESFETLQKFFKHESSTLKSNKIMRYKELVSIP